MGSSRYFGCNGSEVPFKDTNLFSIVPDGDPTDLPPYFLKVRLDFRVTNQVGLCLLSGDAVMVSAVELAIECGDQKPRQGLSGCLFFTDERVEHTRRDRMVVWLYTGVLRIGVEKICN